jgi:hypothetical protein
MSSILSPVIISLASGGVVLLFLLQHQYIREHARKNIVSLFSHVFKIIGFLLPWFLFGVFVAAFQSYFDLSDFKTCLLVFGCVLFYRIENVASQNKMLDLKLDVIDAHQKCIDASINHAHSKLDYVEAQIDLLIDLSRSNNP